MNKIMARDSGKIGIIGFVTNMVWAPLSMAIRCGSVGAGRDETRARTYEGLDD